MIYLYTSIDNEKKKDYILLNDQYFNLYTSNLSMSETEKEAIWDIDQAKLTADNHIETKYGIGTLRNLSSGCKSYLNVLLNPDKIVSVMECGANVLEKLFQLDNVKLFMSHPERFPISQDTHICFNDEEIVIGRKGYEQWWSEEYKRRSEDDLS